MRSRRGRNLRVLLILHELTRTGAPLLALRIFRELGGRHDLRIVAGTGGDLESDFEALGSLTVLIARPPVVLLSGVFRDIPMVGKAYGRLRTPIKGWQARRWRPDVVYANSLFALPLIVRMRLDELPILLHVHELSVMQANFDALFPGLLERLPDRYIAVSEAVASSLRARGIPADAIVVIPPFVETPTSVLRKEREGGPFVVGGMGNPSWTKGVELWLLAAREVVDRLGADKVRFRWVGLRPNEEGRRFWAMVEKLDLTSGVDLVPETPAPLAELSGFDVLAVTSWEDAAPLVVLEAMAVGTPVVCFRKAGGPVEEIEAAGIAVDEFSPGEMARAIVDLLSDDATRRSLADAGRARVREVYEPGRVIGAIDREIADLTTRLPIHQRPARPVPGETTQGSDGPRGPGPSRS